jgi:hypothetical protein
MTVGTGGNEAAADIQGIGLLLGLTDPPASALPAWSPHAVNTSERIAIARHTATTMPVVGALGERVRARFYYAGAMSYESPISLTS